MPGETTICRELFCKDPRPVFYPDDSPMAYQHTQKAPLCLVLYALAGTFLVVAWIVSNELYLVWLFLPTALLILVLAASFHHLTVADQGDGLLIRFGPLPLFRRRVKYDDIESVEVGQTTWLDGWGIHLSVRSGWVWNLWGWDCVILRLRKGTLHIGTDDAEALARFVKGKIRPFVTE